jgi:peptidyl-prolyl cis-trans isomerase D
MMVQKAMYTPTWMAEEYQKNTSTSLDFAYVKIPFEESGEEDLSLSEEDYVNYIQENKAQFETDEESRNAKFVVFNVSPTAQDSADLENLIAELVEPFREAENDSLFVDSNYGSMDVAYFKADAVSPVIADTVFNMEIGEVHGPYIDGNAYKAVKLVDKKIIPDSVDSRHILFRVETAEQFAPAQQRMDSVKALIESGAEQFDSLAMKVSQDPGSGVQGGNLGYAAPGRMVKPFNDMLFYQAEEGELNIVYTQFGIHLIEVLDKKYINNEEGVKLAFIEETIVPSEETQNRIYDDVLEFVASNRDLETLTSTIDQDDDLILEDANMLTKNGYSLANLGGGNSSRDIVRWIFDPGSKVGRVSPEVYIYEDPVDYYNAKYVVAALDKIVPAGLPDVNDVKSQIEDAVRNRKAGETIAANIESKDLNTLAAEYEVGIDTIENVNFGSSFLQGIGAEPKVIATADIIPPEQVSKPIIGTSGVYVIQLLDRSENTPSTDIGRLRQQASMTIHSAVQFELIEAMKNASKIDDSRYNFY